jgi:hypothetical protein
MIFLIPFAPELELDEEAGVGVCAPDEATTVSNAAIRINPHQARCINPINNEFFRLLPSIEKSSFIIYSFAQSRP